MVTELLRVAARTHWIRVSTFVDGTGRRFAPDWSLLHLRRLMVDQSNNHTGLDGLKVFPSLNEVSIYDLPRFGRQFYETRNLSEISHFRVRKDEVQMNAGHL